jgi:hypothetical protein
MFFSDQCVHCTTVIPVWEDIATALAAAPLSKGERVKLAAVDVYIA